MREAGGGEAPGSTAGRAMAAGGIQGRFGEIPAWLYDPSRARAQEGSDALRGAAEEGALQGQAAARGGGEAPGTPKQSPRGRHAAGAGAWGYRSEGPLEPNINGAVRVSCFVLFGLALSDTGLLRPAARTPGRVAPSSN